MTGFGPRPELPSKPLSVRPGTPWVSSGDEPSPTFSRISSTFSPPGKGASPTPLFPHEVCSANSKQVPAALSALSALHKFHLAKNSPVHNPPIKGLSLGGGLRPETGQPSLSPLTAPSACQLGCRRAGFPSPGPRAQLGLIAAVGEGRGAVCALETGDVRAHLRMRWSLLPQTRRGEPGAAEWTPREGEVAHGPHTSPRGPTPLSRWMALETPPALSSTLVTSWLAPSFPTSLGGDTVPPPSPRERVTITFPCNAWPPARPFSAHRGHVPSAPRIVIMTAVPPSHT